jgi:hypothetical protein
VTVKRLLGKFVYLAGAFVAVFTVTVATLDLDWPSADTASVVYLLSSSLFFSLILLAGILRGRIVMTLPHALGAFLLLLVTAGATSAIASENPIQSAVGALPLLAHFLLYLGILTAASDRDFGKTIVKAVVAAGIVLAVFVVYWTLHMHMEAGWTARPWRGHGTTGLFLLLLPTCLGLLFNSIHEKMDHSVLSRRVLYAICIVLFSTALFYVGSVLAWVALAAGLILFFVYSGRRYLSANARHLGLAALCTALVAGAAVASLVLADHPPAGYTPLTSGLTQEANAWAGALGEVVRGHPLGLGFAHETPRHALPQSSLVTFARVLGFPGVGVLLLFFFLSLYSLRPRGTGPVREFEPTPVHIYRRREVPAVELALLGILGGALAFFFVKPQDMPWSHTTFVVLFLPLWLISLTLSFSYKHFAAKVFNQRDFVSIGIASGAAAVGIYSLFHDVLWNISTIAPLVCFLAIALARRAEIEGREKTVDFHSQKYIRLLLGLLCSLTAGAAAFFLTCLLGALG